MMNAQADLFGAMALPQLPVFPSARRSDPATSHAKNGSPRLKNIMGMRFGRLVVVGRRGNIAGRASWGCVCDCGQSREVRGKDLRSGNTSSCGCFRKERASAATALSNTTHGMTKTRTFASWGSMLARCTNTRHKSFAEYGGRGITVCERWMNSFAAFVADMGTRPAGTTIDRVDGNRGYEPSNCRWATPAQQARNTSTNRVLHAFGESRLLVEWAEDLRCSVSYDALWKRLDAGWAPEDAIAAPKYFRRTVTSTSGRQEREWSAVA